MPRSPAGSRQHVTHMPPTRTILITDSDPDAVAEMARELERYGFQTCSADCAQAMLDVLASQHIDLIVMETQLPDADGFSLTRELRRRRRIPVIFVASQAQTYDRIIGLESGADDFLGKPFEPREVVARVRAALRTRDTLGRPAPRDAAKSPWRMDNDNCCLYTDNDALVALSPTEFRLLKAFLRSPGRLLNRDQLLMSVHGDNTRVAPRNVDLLVARLRQKLSGTPQGALAIRTVRGKGYLFRLAASGGTSAPSATIAPTCLPPACSS